MRRFVTVRHYVEIKPRKDGEGKFTTRIHHYYGVEDHPLIPPDSSLNERVEEKIIVTPDFNYKKHKPRIQDYPDVALKIVKKMKRHGELEKFGGFDEFNGIDPKHPELGYQIARRLAEAGMFNMDLIEPLPHKLESKKEQHAVNRKFTLAEPYRDVEVMLNEFLKR